MALAQPPNSPREHRAALRPATQPPLQATTARTSAFGSHSSRRQQGFPTPQLAEQLLPVTAARTSASKAPARLQLTAQDFPERASAPNNDPAQPSGSLRQQWRAPPRSAAAPAAPPRAA